MNLKKNLPIIMIVLLALVAGLGYYYSIKINKTNIYQFNTDLKAGGVIDKNMLVPTETDKKIAESSGYITESQINNVIGRTVTTDVYAGMPVMANYISENVNSSVSLRLSDGKVAYTIPGDALTLVTSDIKYGNYINIYSSIDVGENKMTKEILSNVRVLDAVKTNISSDNPQGTLAGVTVELDAKDITTLAFAKDYGKLSLGLLKNGKQQDKLQIDESKKTMDITSFIK